MRVPRPAATMIAEVIERNFDGVATEDQLAIYGSVREPARRPSGIHACLRNFLDLTTGPDDFKLVKFIARAKTDRDRQFRLRKVAARGHDLPSQRLIAHFHAHPRADGIAIRLYRQV